MASTNFAKHTATNPLVVRLLDRYFTTLSGIVAELEPTSVLDVGCGEGFTAARLRPTVGYRGIDPDPDAIAYARQSLPELAFAVAGIADLGEGEADLVLCLEVLEHL